MSPMTETTFPPILEDLPPERYGPRRNRVTPVAWVVTVVLHGLAIWLYSVLVGPPPPVGVSTQERPEVAVQGLEVIRLVEVATDLPNVLDPEELEAPPVPTIPVVEISVFPEEIEVIGPLGLPVPGAAERLRPQRGDPRLWIPIAKDLVAVSPERLAELRFIWAIEDLNDSATAMAAAAMAGREWIYTDDNGGKWGVSPGKLHLGDLTIPLPFSFAPTFNSDRAQRARDDAEIMRSAGAAYIRESLNERAKAIREQRDKERENRARPDTTRVGRR